MVQLPEVTYTPLAGPARQALLQEVLGKLSSGKVVKLRIRNTISH